MMSDDNAACALGVICFFVHYYSHKLIVFGTVGDDDFTNLATQHAFSVFSKGVKRFVFRALWKMAAASHNLIDFQSNILVYTTALFVAQFGISKLSTKSQGQGLGRRSIWFCPDDIRFRKSLE